MRTISATEFKATCLDLFDQVYAGEIEEFGVTKHGRVVAVVRRPAVTRSDAETLYGCLEGTLSLPADLDLTKPIFEGEINAEDGFTFE